MGKTGANKKIVKRGKKMYSPNKSNLSEDNQKCKLDMDEVEKSILNSLLCCLPASTRDKYPKGIQWKNFNKPISSKQFKNLKQDKHDGICILTGKASGDLEALDFDPKIPSKLFNTLLKEFKNLVELECPGLWKKLVIEQSRRKGRHIFYRCVDTDIPGNTKLTYARVQVDGPGQHEYEGENFQAEQDEDGNYYIYPCVIETRGEGGLILCHPSPGYHLTQNNFSMIPVLTKKERGILIKCAKAFNQYKKAKKIVTGRVSLSEEELKPGEDFNQHGDILPILEKHNWKFLKNHGEYFHLTRPGKETGCSASLIDGKILYVFSTNTTFESEKGYSPFAVYAILEHNGDFQKAAKDLAEKGYGSKNTYEEDGNSNTSILPTPPKFPLHTIPKYFAEVIEQTVKAFQTPIEVPVTTLLSLVGACVGRSRAAVVKSGWTENPNFFLGLVARSGTAKSPPMRAFLNAIFRIEKQRYEQYQAELKKYQLEMDERKGKKSEDLGPPPEKPTWTQIYVEDTTEEALTSALSGNEKGILWYNDELSGLLMNLSRYRSDGKDGGAKARLMSAYDSGPWKRTRKSGDDEYISSACLSILGTLQPDILPELFSNFDAAIGFLPRFIFIRAEPQGPALWTDETLSGEIRDRIDYLVESLIEYELDEEGKPKHISMTEEAKDLYVSWFNEQSMEPWRSFDAHQFEALSAKLRGQCIRIALILHILESHANNTSELVPIQAETMQRAIELSDWIKEHQHQVWTTIGKAGQVTECSPLEKRIASAIASLEDEIQGGKIPTARVTEKVNEGTNENFQVKTEAIGKAANKLGLHTGRNNKQRMITVSPEQLESLKQTVKSVTSVMNTDMEQDTKSDRLSETVTTVTNPNITAEESDRNDRFDKPVTDEGLYNSGDNDRSDRCDCFENNKLNEEAF